MFPRLILLAALFAMPLMSTDEPKMRRLENLSWNPVTNRLTWTVSNGIRNEKGEYEADRDPQTFTIDLQKATMEHQGAQRKFSEEEADNVAAVMGMISKYAQESTMWWEAGKGRPVSGRETVELLPAHPRADWPAQVQLEATSAR